MEFIQPAEILSPDVICPFCKGHEEQTPTQLEVWDHEGQRVETTDSSFDWSTRVVPNKFPAFPSDSPMDPFDTKDLSDLLVEFGPYDQIRNPGVQELIIPTPRHVSSYSELKKSEAMICWAAAQTRFSVLKEKDGIDHAMLFMNCRSAAGASLSHAHLQLIGSPVTSQALIDRVRRNQKHACDYGETLMQAVVKWEREKQDRIVAETDDFWVICPFASRVAYQTWVIPKHSFHDFAVIDRKVRDDLALLVRKVLRRLEKSLDSPPYNLLLHTAPFAFEENNHWYVEIMPRVTRPAGLEWGTDVWVNPVSPEDAAKRLRF